MATKPAEAPAPSANQIESKDAAPAAVSHPQPPSLPWGGANQLEVAARSGLQAAGSGLSQMWDARWSHLPLVQSRSGAQDNETSDTTAKRTLPDNGHRSSPGPSGMLSTEHPTDDAGHISAIAGKPRQQEHGPAEHVAVQLLVDQPADDAAAELVRLRVGIAEAPEQEASKHSSGSKQNRLAQQLEHLAHSQASAAAIQHLTSFAGMLRGHQRQIAEPSSALAEQQPQNASSLSQAEGASVDTAAGAKTVQPDPAREAAASETDAVLEGSIVGAAATHENSVSLEIEVSEGEESQQPLCRVFLTAYNATERSVNPAAMVVPEGGSSSRFNALSSLFWSSRPATAAAGKAQDAKPKPSEQSLKSPVTEISKQQEGAPEAVMPAKQQQTSSQGWAITGAIGSLYGFVSHAAEAAVHSRHQVIDQLVCQENFLSYVCR